VAFFPSSYLTNILSNGCDPVGMYSCLSSSFSSRLVFGFVIECPPWKGATFLPGGGKPFLGKMIPFFFSSRRSPLPLRTEKPPGLYGFYQITRSKCALSSYGVSASPPPASFSPLQVARDQSLPSAALPSLLTRKITNGPLLFDNAFWSLEQTST